jgi:hypothetical protein
MYPFLSARVMIFGVLLAVAGCSNCFSQDLTAEPIAIQLGEPTSKSLVSFRKSLISSAEKSCKAGELSRADLFRIRIGSLHKPTLEKMHQACAEQILADGQAASYGAIDWEKLAAFLKEMLPIILELIKLFS